MKKILSVILVLATLFVCFPTVAKADALYSITVDVTYDNDLIYLKFTVNTTAAEGSGINTIELEYEPDCTSLNTKLEYVSTDLSGLPASDSWYQMAANKTVNDSGRIEVQLINESFDSSKSIYSATSPAYFIITLRNKGTAEVESISFTNYRFAIMDDDWNDYSSDYGEVDEVSIPQSFSVNMAQQAPEPSLSLLGAQMRTSAPQGLRFIAKLEKDEFYQAFKIDGNYNYTRDSSTVSFGVIIAISSTVSGDLTIASTCKKLDIKAENIFAEDENDLYFTGVITDFPSDGSYDDTMFTAVAYAKVGSEYYYSASIERSVNYVKTHAPENA